MRIAFGCVLLDEEDLKQSHHIVKARLFERVKYRTESSKAYEATPVKPIEQNFPGRELSEWRAALGIGQRELARQAGVSQGRITWAENKGWASDVTVSALRRVGFEGGK